MPILKSLCGRVCLFLILATFANFPSPVVARDTAPADVPFPDGSIGSASAECGVDDLCATLVLPNKDRIEIYNQGAGYCQPFSLSIIRMRGDVVLLKNQTTTASKRVKEGLQHFDCYQFVNTYLTFDQGAARLGLFLSHDGTLFAEWDIQQSDSNH